MSRRGWTRSGPLVCTDPSSTRSGPTGPSIHIGEREVVQLASNDYLAWPGDPALADAVARSAAANGAGTGAAPLITGYAEVHRRAEAALADLVGQPDAALFPTGYMANVGAVQSLVGPGDLLLSDALNHASLIDGARLSGAKVVVYPHRDVGRLEALLVEHRAHHRAALVITDAIFSMDATEAPLRALRHLCDAHGAGLLVDEAHALGIVGPEGRGLGARDAILADVTIGTLGKSFGLMGAFAAAAPSLVDWIRNRARSYVFATGLSPAIAGAIPTAVERVRSADDRRRSLAAAARALAEGLLAKGYDVRPGTGPILPVWIGEPGPTVALSETLLHRGVLIRAIRPPTVPAGTSRLRVVPNAATTAEHVARALAAFPPASPNAAT